MDNLVQLLNLRAESVSDTQPQKGTRSA